MTQPEVSDSGREPTRVSAFMAAVVILLALFGSGALVWYFVTHEDTLFAGAAGPPVGPRASQTRIQSAALDLDNAPGAVQLWYLDMPYGPVTFGYIENGGDTYYSQRTWPFAHLKLGIQATYEGKQLEPGDYVLVLTPRGMEPAMTLSLASFKPAPDRPTFLVAGDVTTRTPAGAVEIHKKPVVFEKGAPATDHLEIGLEKSPRGVSLRIHYGDRTLTEELAVP